MTIADYRRYGAASGARGTHPRVIIVTWSGASVAGASGHHALRRWDVTTITSAGALVPTSPSVLPATVPDGGSNVFRIVEAKLLGPGVKQFEIEAPRIARKQRAGQFVIVRVHDTGERIPLTIKASDPARGSITIVVQAVGKTTTLLNELRTDDAILDVVGPLGKPSEVERYGRCVVIGGGVGTAIALPTARALHEVGNHVIAILGARTRELLLLEEEVRRASDELFAMTDDGSYGEKGLVTDKLRELIETRSVDYVLAIGPVPMMRAVAETTRPSAIRTVVSLNAIMVDGTGMCGGCRVLVGGESKFACVDGPEFDAHAVDFAVLTQRNAMYREQERAAMESIHA